MYKLIITILLSLSFTACGSMQQPTDTALEYAKEHVVIKATSVHLRWEF